MNIDAVRVDSGDPGFVEDVREAANAVAKFKATSTVATGRTIDIAIDPAELAFFDSHKTT